MKRFISLIICSGLCAFTLSAYNPPINGDNLFELASPHQIADASSVTGGAIFYGGPDSILVNPALPASEQRVSLNLSYTALINTDKADSNHFSSAYQLGIVIPFKFAVFTGLLDGVHGEFDNMNVGNTLSTKLALSKEISERLNIGLGLNTGLFWAKNSGSDWMLSGNIGYLYTFGDAGFLKDFKYGVSVLNLGKNVKDVELSVLNKKDTDLSAFPTLATVKVGASGLFVSNSAVKFGFSFGVTTPMFMNVIFDAGLQFSVKDCFYIHVADRFNLSEFCNGHKDFLPSIGIGVRFTFDFNNDYMQKNGWEQSEVSSTFVYKNYYQTINAFSLGVDMNLGMQDTTPPVITLWNNEGDDE